MAAQAVVVANARKSQSSERARLSSLVALTYNNLRMQKVLVLKFGSCSADVHKDLAGMNLKLKFRMNGNTYLKSKPRKTSVGADDKLRIKFDIDGDAIYEGGELFHFELCRVGLFTSSQALASCAVSAMQVFASVGRTTAGVDQTLELRALDTPSKVLANLMVHISFTTSTLDDVGGFRMLKLLTLPVDPIAVSSVSVFSYNEDRREILDFLDKAQGVAGRLRAIHEDTIGAIAARPLVEMADDVSTSCGSSSSRKSSVGTKSVEMASSPMDESLHQPISPQQANC